MAAGENGRYRQDVHSGAYLAGKALGIAAKDEVVPVLFLGCDLAFRVISQVFLDRSDADAVHLVDLAMQSFMRGYYDGKGKGQRS